MWHVRYFWIFAIFDILSSKILLKKTSNFYIFLLLDIFFLLLCIWSWRLLCLVWIRCAEYLYRQDPRVLAAATSVVHLSHPFTVLKIGILCWNRDPPYSHPSWVAPAVCSHLLHSCPVQCSHLLQVFCLILQHILNSAYCTQCVVPKSIPGNLVHSQNWALYWRTYSTCRGLCIPQSLWGFPLSYTCTLHQDPAASPPWIPHPQTLFYFLSFLPSSWIQIGYHGYVLAVMSTHLIYSVSWREHWHIGAPLQQLCTTLTSSLL